MFGFSLGGNAIYECFPLHEIGGQLHKSEEDSWGVMLCGTEEPEEDEDAEIKTDRRDVYVGTRYTFLLKPDETMCPECQRRFRAQRRHKKKATTPGAIAWDRKERLGRIEATREWKKELVQGEA